MTSFLFGKSKTRALCGLTLFLSSGGRLSAQESSSKGHAHPAPALSADSPAAALRDALSAACTQNQKEFGRFLTERNAQAFAQLTPTARIELMKRFVLLNQPGTASVTSTATGRPTVRCDINGGGAELQIGGVDASDNLAFLPVEARDVTDRVGNSTVHVNMGLVRENGQWKLLSVGLLLLDLPALSAEWDAAQIETTERSAIAAMKEIADAVESYRKTYGRLPDTLANLKPPQRGPAGLESAGLLDGQLASGEKDGYVFRYVILGGSTIGAPAQYEIAATPRTYARTGRRSFFRDTEGGLHAADRQGGVGSAADAILH
jgi:hypothetical protein